MIGVLTYNVPHKKTQATLFLLKALGYVDIFVYAVNQHYVKKFYPLIEHRSLLSAVAGSINIKDFCKKLGYKYYFSKNGYNDLHDIFPTDSLILVCGAGIIPDDIIHQYKFINSHPGYIPLRGLDVLKWAIYKKLPLGVTTHLIDSQGVDVGYVIERKLVPVHENDTFHSLAQRSFDIEIDMLINSIQNMNGDLEFLDAKRYPIFRRMPNKMEKELFTKFNEYKEIMTKNPGGGGILFKNLQNLCSRK